MKLNVLKAYNSRGKYALLGYEFIAETPEEEQDLNILRDQIFFGIGDRLPKYAGREDNEETGNVAKLRFEVPDTISRTLSGHFKAELPKEWFERIQVRPTNYGFERGNFFDEALKNLKSYGNNKTNQ